jgi:hypothetical protein
VLTRFDNYRAPSCSCHIPAAFGSDGVARFTLMSVARPPLARLLLYVRCVGVVRGSLPSLSTFWLIPSTRCPCTKVSARWATQRIRGGPKVHGMIDAEEPRRRHEELMREAELYRLKKALRASRKAPAVSQWTSTVAWELMRFVGRLRKFFRTPKNTG